MGNAGNGHLVNFSLCIYCHPFEIRNSVFAFMCRYHSKADDGIHNTRTHTHRHTGRIIIIKMNRFIENRNECPFSDVWLRWFFFNSIFDLLNVCTHYKITTILELLCSFSIEMRRPNRRTEMVWFLKCSQMPIFTLSPICYAIVHFEFMICPSIQFFLLAISSKFVIRRNNVLHVECRIYTNIFRSMVVIRFSRFSKRRVKCALPH